MSDLLKTSEAAKFLGVSQRTLEDWRYKEVGPEFHSLGFRTVRYAMDSLELFIAGKKNLKRSRRKKTAGPLPGQMPLFKRESPRVRNPAGKIVAVTEKWIEENAALFHVGGYELIQP